MAEAADQPPQQSKFLCECLLSEGTLNAGEFSAKTFLLVRAAEGGGRSKEVGVFQKPTTCCLLQGELPSQLNMDGVK